MREGLSFQITKLPGGMGVSAKVSVLRRVGKVSCFRRENGLMFSNVRQYNFKGHTV